MRKNPRPQHQRCRPRPHVPPSDHHSVRLGLLFLWHGRGADSGSNYAHGYFFYWFKHLGFFLASPFSSSWRLGFARDWLGKSRALRSLLVSKLERQWRLKRRSCRRKHWTSQRCHMGGGKAIHRHCSNLHRLWSAPPAGAYRRSPSATFSAEIITVMGSPTMNGLWFDYHLI